MFLFSFKWFSPPSFVEVLWDSKQHILTFLNMTQLLLLSCREFLKIRFNCYKRVKNNFSSYFLFVFFVSFNEHIVLSLSISWFENLPSLAECIFISFLGAGYGDVVVWCPTLIYANMALSLIYHPIYMYDEWIMRLNIKPS